MAKPIIKWLPLLSKFLGGQAFIQIINLCTALVLLRLLPLDEYALFIIATFYLNFGSLGSDLNLSTAFSTYGARLTANKAGLSGLFALVVSFRRKLYPVMVLLILIATPYMVKNHGWRLEAVIAVLLPIFVTIWVQQKLTLRNVVLNIYHDSTGVFQSNLIGAVARLVLTYAFCVVWPFATIAVLCNLMACVVESWMAKRKCLSYIDESCVVDDGHRDKVKQFIYPLIPAAAYFAAQGQISILLISLFGNSESIAEVGALSRFGQVFAFLATINGFFFQPKFSRIQDKTEFIGKSITVTSILLLGFGVLMCSAWLVPEWWLFLLGKNYASLQSEVPLALAGPIANYFFGFFFTLLAARAFTQGQFWYIAATLAVQIFFIAAVGVDTTHKALQLNLANATATMLVQIILLYGLIKKWQ